MQRIAPPYLAMSGVQLGLGLSELAHKLVEESRTLVSIDPNDKGMRSRDSERVRIAANGNWQMPVIRARLHRYATLAVAKQRPEAVPLPQEADYTKGNLEAALEAVTYTRDATPVSVALEVASLCRNLVECEDETVEGISRQLDFALEKHARLCWPLADELTAKANELDERDD